MANSPSNKPSVVHTLSREADTLVQDLASLGDKAGLKADKLLSFVLEFMPASYKATKPKDRKPTWYAEMVTSAWSNLISDKAIAKRFKEATYKAWEINQEATNSDYPILLTEGKDKSYRPTQAGETPDLKLDQKTLMSWTSNDMTVMKSKGAKDPTNPSFDQYGASRAEWVQPERNRVTTYSAGKLRDTKGSLVKALKRLHGVATNVATATEVIEKRIPNKLAEIESMRTRSVSNGKAWSAESDKMFDEGVALIKKSCR